MIEVFATAGMGFTLVLLVGAWLEQRDQARRAEEWDAHCADALDLTGDTV